MTKSDIKPFCWNKHLRPAGRRKHSKLCRQAVKRAIRRGDARSAQTSMNT